MIIRSQDKKMILNFNCIDTLRVKSFRFEKNENLIKYQILYYGVGEYDGFLANYSTEEKAIKVLDMIQGAYVKCEALKSLSSGTMVEVSKIMDEEQSKEFIELYKSNFVFEMPQDSEV